MPVTRTDFAAILRVLREHGVDVIVVGGVAAVLAGAPVYTFDLDVVHSRRPENIERLLQALASLDAHYRLRPEIRPNGSHVSSPGHSLLSTRFGALDLLGVIGQHDGYDELVSHTTPMVIDGDLSALVLNLDKLIQMKEQAGREKDLAALPMLRRTLEERNRR